MRCPQRSEPMKRRSKAGGKSAKAQPSESLKLKPDTVPKAAAGRSSAVRQTTDWLERLGLGQYAQRFVENDIDFALFTKLTDADLKELGVISLGHRKRLLEAIAERAALAPPPTLAESKASDTAERRQVTVMFSDLVGSTALAAYMDPEDLREVISAYQKCVAEIVSRFGGFVAKYMGDGVLVYFGYPQAHEDDAERAVRAGLELIAAVSALKVANPLQTRVGIATGIVVVGDLVGSGESQERGIVGETPNLAARLQGIAEPNTVVVAESTRKLVGNLFELQDLGAKEVKGIAERVRAWAALRTSSAEGRFEALHASGLTALVGREEEFELLLRRWSKAKTGEGQVVLLSGEAGIGKSRLTAALLEHLASEPHTRLRYFCSPQHTDSALYPIISQMERAAAFTHGDAAQAKLDKLDSMLVQTTTSNQDAALFAEMLSLPNDGRHPALHLDPQQRRQKTLEALTAQMEALSRQNPVLMIFEDAHWTDPTSLEAFGRTVDQIKTLPALLIVAFRPEFNAPWAGRSHVTSVALNRLGGRETAAIIARLVGNKELPSDVMAEIVERTDGIPLFVEEMTKAVLEAEGEARQTAAAIPSPALAVPASLQASLMARLDRLGSAKEIAQIGAAIGREFSHALLAAAVDKPEAELQAALDRLIAAGLMFRQGIPPHATYLFKHALVQDAAYGTLLRSRRQRLHARIAAILEEKFPEVVAAQPTLMAQHCTEAGLRENAISYFLKAGQQAIARSAMSEAVAVLQRGLDVLASVPNDPNHDQRELELRAALVPALIATKGYSAPEVGTTVVRARSLAEKLERSEYIVGLLYGEWIFRLVRAELRLALSHAKNLEQIGRTRNDLASELLGRHWAQGTTLYLLGDFAAARTLLEHANGLQHPAHRAAYAAITANDPYASTLAYLALTLTLLGYIDQGRQRMNEAVSEARQLRSPHSLAEVLSFACMIERICGSPWNARRFAEEVVALSSEHSFPSWLAIGTIHLGWSFAALGDPTQGLDLISKGISLRVCPDTLGRITKFSKHEPN